MAIEELIKQGEALLLDVHEDRRIRGRGDDVRWLM